MVGSSTAGKAVGVGVGTVVVVVVMVVIELGSGTIGEAENGARDVGVGVVGERCLSSGPEPVKSGRKLEIVPCLYPELRLGFVERVMVGSTAVVISVRAEGGSIPDPRQGVNGEVGIGGSDLIGMIPTSTVFVLAA